MADLGWFRNFGQRPKTPTITMAGPPGAAPEEPDNLTSPSKTAQSPTRRLHRAPAVRRVSSLLSLAPTEQDMIDTAPPALPSSASFMTTKSSDSSSAKAVPADEHHVDMDGASLTTTAVARPEYPDFFVNEADRVWHAPSLDQMVESLQVAMMNMPSTFEPVPVKYNAHILALLEGYGKIWSELRETKLKAERDVEGIRQMRCDELESYRILSEDWLQRQKDYTAEIKRLELMLALHTKDGMATVALARAGSVVDRGARARKGFEERVKRLSRGDDDADLEAAPVKAGPETLPLGRKASVYTHIAHIPANLDPDNDRRVSRQVAEEERKEKRLTEKAKKDKRHKHKFWKHRHHSKGKKSKEKHDKAAPDRDGDMHPPAAADAGDHDGRPNQTERGGRGAADPSLYAEFISSSSSAYMLNSSSSSSDDTDVLWKGKGVARHYEQRNRHADPDTQPPQHTTSGTDEASTHHGTRTMGELAIERFLEDGTIVAGAIEHGGGGNLGGNHLEAIPEDYFAQPRRADQRRRARGFSFIAGADESLPVSPMALPPPAQLEGGESAEASQSSSLERLTIQVPAPTNIRQPRPWGTLSQATGLSVAQQLQEAVATETGIDATSTTTTTSAQTLGNLFRSAAATAPATLPNQSRPPSTGTVIHTGADHASTAPGNRDSTGSRITVVRDNSGRASTRRQSSQSQATSDLSFESASAGMPPITEGRSSDFQPSNPVSPTLSTRGGGSGGTGRRKSGGRSRGGMAASSVASSPALPAADGGDSRTQQSISSFRPSSPPLPPPVSSNRPTQPRREASGAGGGGGSEAGGTATAAQAAARIAAQLAHQRGQKRSNQS